MKSKVHRLKTTIHIQSAILLTQLDIFHVEQILLLNVTTGIFVHQGTCQQFQTFEQRSPVVALLLHSGCQWVLGLQLKSWVEGKIHLPVFNNSERKKRLTKRKSNQLSAPSRKLFLKPVDTSQQNIPKSLTSNTFHFEAK